VLGLSSIQIINSALVRLGVERISSIDDEAKRAKIMKTMYDVCRRRVLEDHQWGFSLKRVALSEVLPPPLFGYGHYFQLPIDYLRLVEIYELQGNIPNYIYPTYGEKKLYEIEGDKIATDMGVVSINYVYDCIDTTLFSPYFTKAFYLELAAECCFSILQSISILGDIRKEKEEVLAVARSIEASQDSSDISVDPNDLVFVRGSR